MLLLKSVLANTNKLLFKLFLVLANTNRLLLKHFKKKLYIILFVKFNFYCF